MSVRKKVVVIGVVLIAAGAFSCATICRRAGQEGLRFVRGPGPQPSTVRGMVVVTHGWIEKGRGNWPEDMAVAISGSVDADYWLCGYFEWPRGARTINATKAAEYARDIAGPKLAREILDVGANLEHVHMIGHSGGCWVISEAAKILAGRTQADLHLTFLDAYVPMFWEEDSLGDVNAPAGAKYWVDHYYTRDYTLSWTQHDLNCAHNVDLTKVDQYVKDHNFPWKWYHATITGEYPKGYLLDNRKLVSSADGVEYGFGCSRESGGADTWNRTVKLPVDNNAVRLRKKPAVNH